MESRVLPTLNLQTDDHELCPSNYCNIRQISFTMAKIGYIMAVSQYDKLEEDRQWMTDYGCIRIVFRILNKHGIKLNRGNHSGPIKRKGVSDNSQENIK